MTVEAMQALARLFEINLEGLDEAALTEQLRGGFEGLADLRKIETDGVEPFVVFPIDRVQA
ncbi:hypothetical protein K32_26080 [Kaistia sp. 32K]|nr:hypothetical protein K32_26080 [Kaistia sp. 32K]